MSVESSGRAPSAVALGDLAADPAGVMRRVAAESSTLLVTEGERALVVVMGVAAYARLRRDCERLRLLALGELEAATGDGYDLSDVLDDARSLLAEN